MQKRIFVNNQIRAKEVRLIDEKGAQVGVVSLEAALSLAKERGYDLIQVTEKVQPPVCKLADYGKYLYQQDKKERQYKKQQGGGLKEVRLTFNISPHDMETRANQAQKFLLKGDRVRVALRLRGREKYLKNFARGKAEKFVDMLNQKIPVKIERGLQEEPRGLAMLLTKK
ncbi:MAG: translation initiation factor IF-3 [Parcubacteria group bacterium Greene0714_21]|nr:MAG: translation initiation factor IF-3 [Parcubacteria group bacterium Greene0416_39]TSC97336.1 MAG: translation initiation factor IF-3 [Parcubacteria group bacterium Greene1014_47]TSD03937.1 MAG: translation initiation factor IF-3 [Parcubacteria group bacterium Greene0714_21]